MTHNIVKIGVALVGILSFVEVSGQTFDYFENNPEWRVSHIDFTNIEPPEDVYGIREQYIYYFNGDSIINDTEYLKLYERGEVSHEIGITVEFNRFNSLVRQEEKKVYEIVGGEEILIYDFDLEIGDVFPDLIDRYYNNSLFPETVESIDSVLINNNYHKVFYGMGNGPLVEGIGHGQGAFFNEPIFGPLDHFFVLHCYRQLGEVEYIVDQWSECNFNVSVERYGGNTKFSIFPNPTTNYLNVSIPDVPAEFRSNTLELKLTNLQGQTVFAQSLNTLDVTFIMDVAEYSSGVYFLSLVSEGVELNTQKVILK